MMIRHCVDFYMEPRRIRIDRNIATGRTLLNDLYNLQQIRDNRHSNDHLLFCFFEKKNGVHLVARLP